MKMHSLLVLVLLQATAMTTSLPAQTATPRPVTPGKSAATVDPKKAPLIDEIFQLTKPEAMMQQMLAQYKMAFSQAASQGFEQEVRKFDDPAKYRSDFTKLQDKVFGLLSSRLQWQKLKPQFAQVYSDTFTTDELSGIAAFYKSPAGQASINKMPSLIQKCSQIGQQQMAGAGPEIQKMMTDFMDDLKKRSQSSKPAAPPAK